MIIEIDGLKIYPAYLCFQDGGDGGGDGASGDGASGDGASGDGVSGDGVSGDGVSGDGVSSDGVSGDGVSGDGDTGVDGLSDSTGLGFGYGEGDYGFSPASPGDLGEMGFDISLEAYTPPPSFDISLEAYTPPPSFDINEAFNLALAPYTPPPTFEAYAPPVTSQIQSFDLGKLATDVDKGISLAIKGLGFTPYGFIGSIIGLVGEAFRGITGIFGVNEGKGYTPTQAIASIFGPVQTTTKPSPGPAPSPSPSQPSGVVSMGKGTSISFSKGTFGNVSGGSVLNIPVASLQVAPKSPLVSTQAQREGGGLMIFATSTKGVEPSGSSLLKKQESPVSMTPLLFLLGMGAAGMILRKGVRS